MTFKQIQKYCTVCFLGFADARAHRGFVSRDVQAQLLDNNKQSRWLMIDVKIMGLSESQVTVLEPSFYSFGGIERF